MAILREKLIIATAINMVVEINQTIVENIRKQRSASLQLPMLFNRAFTLVHETGMLPVTDWTGTTTLADTATVEGGAP